MKLLRITDTDNNIYLLIQIVTETDNGTNFGSIIIGEDGFEII